MKNYDYCYNGHPMQYHRVTYSTWGKIKFAAKAIAGVIVGLGSLAVLIVLVLGV